MKSTGIERRDFLKLTAIGGMLSLAPGSRAEAEPAPRRGGPTPLAQDYVVVTKVPDKKHFIHDPGMALLPNGKLVVCAPCWRRPARPDDINKYVSIIVSEDQGRTWKTACERPYAEATLFVHQGRLYMFTQHETFKGVWVTASDDEGKTWLEPVEVIKGAPDRQHWNLQAGMVVKDGWLYWANGKAYQAMGAVACDLRRGLLNPAAWRASEVVEMPIPDALVSGHFESGATMRCLEGNVVDVQGRLLVIARAVINRYGTANMAAVFDLKNDAGRLELTFTQLISLPGGQCKFYILFDALSNMYWMASNLPTNSLDLIHSAERFPAYSSKSRTLREDRRNLMLSYSLDAINWFPAGCIARAEKMTQSFMYPTMIVDGADLVLLSRTGKDSGDYHDADLATFHRVRDFRALAMDIAPKL